MAYIYDEEFKEDFIEDVKNGVGFVVQKEMTLGAAAHTILLTTNDKPVHIKKLVVGSANTDFSAEVVVDNTVSAAGTALEETCLDRRAHGATSDTVATHTPTIGLAGTTYRAVQGNATEFDLCEKNKLIIGPDSNVSITITNAGSAKVWFEIYYYEPRIIGTD